MLKQTITFLGAFLLAPAVVLLPALCADDSGKNDSEALKRARTESATIFKNEVSPFIST